MGPYRKSRFRSIVRRLALLLPPIARLLAEWDELHRRYAAAEERCRHLEMAKGESDRPLMEQARQHLALASAPLATANPTDFRKVAAFGLELAAY